MSGFKSHRSPATYILFLFFIFFSTTTGCSTLSQDTQDPSAPPKKSNAKNAPVYHEFEDVLIPREMEKDRDESFIYETTGLTAGVLTLEGRVEIDSLMNFFETNMAKDNWRLVSNLKSEFNLMLFQKDNRWCVIAITEGTYYTRARVWVAPTITSSGGLLK